MPLSSEVYKHHYVLHRNLNEFKKMKELVLLSAKWQTAFSSTIIMSVTKLQDTRRKHLNGSSTLPSMNEFAFFFQEKSKLEHFVVGTSFNNMQLHDITKRREEN